MERVYIHLNPENIASLFVMFLVFTVVCKSIAAWRAGNLSADA